MPHPAEVFFEDETLTEGLTDDEARDLLAWLVGLADEMEGEDPAYIEQLKRLGRHLARLSARWGVPRGRPDRPGGDRLGGPRPAAGPPAAAHAGVTAVRGAQHVVGSG